MKFPQRITLSSEGGVFTVCIPLRMRSKYSRRWWKEIVVVPQEMRIPSIVWCHVEKAVVRRSK
jgi:hypothetical protein